MTSLFPDSEIRLYSASDHTNMVYLHPNNEWDFKRGRATLKTVPYNGSKSNKQVGVYIVAFIVYRRYVGCLYLETTISPFENESVREYKSSELLKIKAYEYLFRLQYHD